MEKLAFGRFVFDCATEVLLDGSEPVLIGSRGIRLLGLFLRRCGEVITKDELIDAAWPGCSVEEANLSVQVSQLRRRLGPATDGGQWIVTVPRVGYRFVQPVEAIPISQGKARPPKLVILPFEEPGDNPAGRALVDNLTVALSRVPVATVIRPKSNGGPDVEPADVREVATQLGASYLIEGGVRPIGDRTRATVHLMDGEGTYLWSQHFDDEGTHDPADGDGVSERIAAAVEPQLYLFEIARSRRERPQSVMAYDLYLRALHLMQETRRDAHTAARALLNQALQLEPENVSFIAAACEILHHAVSAGWPGIGPDDTNEMLELAHRGIRLAGDDGRSLSLFGLAIVTARQFDLGREIVRRAVATRQGGTFVDVAGGLNALWQGRLDEAERYYTRGLRGGLRDPSIKFALGGLSAVHRRREDFEESLRWARLAFAVNPNYSATSWTLIASSALTGRMHDARRHLEHYQRVSPGVTLATIAAGQPIEDPALLDALLAGLRLGGLPEGKSAAGTKPPTR